MSIVEPSQENPLHILDSEARYRLLFENSLDGILLTAPDGRIFDANPSACTIFRRTREEIIAAGERVCWILPTPPWRVALKNENVRVRPMSN